MRRHPDRLGGLAALPMQDPGAAVEELSRAVRELGQWGAAIGTSSPSHGTSEVGSFYETVVALDVPLLSIQRPQGSTDHSGDPNLKRFDLDIIVGFGAQEAIAVSTLIFGGVRDRHPKLDVWIITAGSAAVMVGRPRKQRRNAHGPASTRRTERSSSALPDWFDTHLSDGRALALLK